MDFRSGQAVERSAASVCLNIVDMFAAGNAWRSKWTSSIGGMRVKRSVGTACASTPAENLQRSPWTTGRSLSAGQYVDEWAYLNRRQAGVHPDWESRSRMLTSKASTEKFRDKCLNTHYFSTLQEAREKISNWRDEYNTFIPHRDHWKGLTPQEFRIDKIQRRNSP